MSEVKIMSHKSPFDPRIAQEWEALSIFVETPVPADEKKLRAKALFESCVSDGRWIVSIADAGLATYPAVVSAMEGSRFQEAAEFLPPISSAPGRSAQQIHQLRRVSKLPSDGTHSIR